MKFFLHFLLLVVAFTILGIPCTSALAASKVTICHIPPGNPDNAHTITVSKSAVPAHLAHGDVIGPCNSGESTGAGTLSLAGATYVACDDREGETGRTITISLVGKLQTNRFQCD
jgi:hypothetical protein